MTADMHELPREARSALRQLLNVPPIDPFWQWIGKGGEAAAPRVKPENGRGGRGPIVPLSCSGENGESGTWRLPAALDENEVQRTEHFRPVRRGRGSSPAWPLFTTGPNRPKNLKLQQRNAAAQGRSIA